MTRKHRISPFFHIFGMLQDALEWVKEIKLEIADEDESEVIERLTEYLNAVKEATLRFGIKIPPDLEDDAVLPSRPGDAIAGQEMDFGNFEGPYGAESRRRYAMNGTYGLFMYARQNQAKFEAYEEVEKRLLAFYKDMMRERQSNLLKGRVGKIEGQPVNGEDIYQMDQVKQNKEEPDIQWQQEHHDLQWHRGEAASGLGQPGIVKVEVNSYIESIRKGSDSNPIAVSSVEPELIGIIRECDQRKKPEIPKDRLPRLDPADSGPRVFETRLERHSDNLIPPSSVVERGVGQSDDSVKAACNPEKNRPAKVESVEVTGLLFIFFSSLVANRVHQ